MRLSAFVGLALLLGGIAGAFPSPAASTDIVSGMGHDLAQKLCSSCHLIEPGQANPPDHIGGAAFQTVADRPKVSVRSLDRHLRTTHTNAMIPLAMPNPQLTRDELIKIIGYITSLRMRQ